MNTPTSPDPQPQSAPQPPNTPHAPQPPNTPHAPQPPRPSLNDIADRLHVVQLPLRTSFRGLTVREVALFEGPAGWGEFAAFPEYAAPETARWLDCALEMAFLGPPSPRRPSVEVNGTIPASVAPQDVEKFLTNYPGVRTVKVKVAEQGSELIDDIERIAAVHAANPELRIRCDANGAWSVPDALAAATALAEAAGGTIAAGGALDYIEQPCRTVEELAELRKRLRNTSHPATATTAADSASTPAVTQKAPRIAADESIRRADDPAAVMRLRAADVAVVKAAPLGGPRAVLALAEQFASHNMTVTISSALESAVGMFAGLATAAALPEQHNAAGLGTGSLFLEDVAAPRPIVDGRIAATPVVPDPARLAALAAPAARRDWWLDRVRACWPLLNY
ncbi:o-succinylbenzoate synthase [Corynebacterium ulceribovis]|uniref:o-succinylbenzoate synthase n=1 Tax=Corynebacterium ulceribovis TaxID=487732 RepID=UPI0003A1B3BE|nr:o-succinylbenzoate synthase [Corynebacterium ulceribovis]